MMKQPGEMHLRTAARILKVSVKTVRAWARGAWEGKPVRNALQYGRRDPSNRYYVNEEEVRLLKESRAERLRTVQAALAARESAA